MNYAVLISLACLTIACSSDPTDERAVAPTADKTGTLAECRGTSPVDRIYAASRGVSRIAVDGDALAIMKDAIADGAPVEVALVSISAGTERVLGRASGARDIRMTPDHVLWVGDIGEDLWAAPRAATTAMANSLAFGVSTRIAGAHPTFFAGQNSYPANVVVPLSAGGVQAPIASGTWRPTDMSMAGGVVAWSDAAEHAVFAMRPSDPAPRTITKGSVLRFVAVDGVGRVYWADGDAVRSEAGTTYSTSEKNPTAGIVNESFLYWRTPNAVRRVPLDHSTDPYDVVVCGSSIGSFAIDGGHLFLSTGRAVGRLRL